MKVRESFVSNSSSSSFQLRSTKEYLTAPLVIVKYPLRNKEWIEMKPLHMLTDGEPMKFAAPWKQYPSLENWPPLDPWNREFVHEPEIVKNMFTTDDGIEVGGWRFHTSVDGWPVECLLLFGDLPTVVTL